MSTDNLVNPQTEDGHLDLANELVEVLAKTYLSPNEWQIIFAIWRKTYCWHKKEDWISFSQFRELTGMADSHISRTLKKLIDSKIVTHLGKSYSFNKVYTEWLPKQVTRGKRLPKQVSKLPKQVSVVTYLGKKKLPKQADTKETTKETTTKESIDILNFWNEVFNKKGKSKNFDSNLKFWLETYTVDEIKEAITISSKDEFWRSRITLNTLLRQKNPNKEPVDRIGDMLNKKNNKPRYTEY